MTARDKYRAAVAEALTDWRLGTLPPRTSIRYEQQLVRSVIAEVTAIRLTAVCAPLFATLNRMEAQLMVLTGSGKR